MIDKGYRKTTKYKHFGKRDSSLWDEQVSVGANIVLLYWGGGAEAHLVFSYEA